MFGFSTRVKGQCAALTRIIYLSMLTAYFNSLYFYNRKF